MSYTLEGQLLEVCECKVLCPCWIGEDPHNGTCDSVVAYLIEQGDIQGIDVSGMSVAQLLHIAGNVLDGDYRCVLVLDDRATPEQQNALTEAFNGELGVALAEMAELVGTLVEAREEPMECTVVEGRGILRIGNGVSADMEPCCGPDGDVTTLNDSIHTAIPGSPAYVSRATHWTSSEPQLRWDTSLENHTAIQGAFRFEG